MGYRQWKEVRTLVGSLLGEVTEFVSSDMCTEALSCDGKRLSIEEALDQLKVLHGDYGGLGILPDEAIARTTDELLSQMLPEQCHHLIGFLRRELRLRVTFRS